MYLLLSRHCSGFATEPSIAVLLVLGIYLRERGSPESKPVAAPHARAGH
jgi:hypothetical protein